MQTNATPAAADPLQRHRLDLNAVENGKVIDVDGDLFRVASYTAKAVADERAAFLAEKGLAKDSDVPAHMLEALQERIFSRAILRGCKLREAPEVAYTPALGARIYSDPEFAKLARRITEAALGDFTKDTVAKAAVLGNC